MEKTKIPKEAVIKDYTMLIHLSMAKGGSYKHTGVISWPANWLDGKRLFCESFVAKKNRPGQSSTNFYLEGNNTPTFTTIYDLINHYSKTHNQKF